MLIITEDNRREDKFGRYLVELIGYRNHEVEQGYEYTYNRFGYWCDKPHLSHFISEFKKVFTAHEILEILKMKQSQKTISDYCKEAHETAKEKGFYDEKPNIPTLLMLIVSELSEALEEDRKIRNFNCNMESGVVTLDADTHFEEEIADTFIRLFDLCGYLNIDIEKVIKMKMEKNKERPHKHGKRY